jgi:tripartite-type tricarboxylate transporter receptor subunit TctC
MKRLLVRSASFISALMILTAGAAAGPEYPTRAVTIVVPAAAGGPTDAVTRILAEGLKHTLGQSIVVENRGGASTMIGAAAVARAPKDGYTLLMATASTLATSPHLYKTVNYKLTDFASITMIAKAPLAFAVRPNLPVATVQDFVSLARARPGELNYGTSGVGSMLHVAGELFADEAGIRMRAVPYQGSAPALTDLLGGTLDGVVDAVQTSAPFHRHGQIRMLAVFASQRLAQLPDVPTFAEAGFPSLVASTWFVLSAPIGTPEPVLTKLNEAVVAALASPDLKSQLEDAGYIVTPSSRKEAREFVRNESRLWRKVIRKARLVAG